MFAITTSTDAAFLSEYIPANLLFRFEDKQAILDEGTLMGRLHLLIEKMHRERRMLEIDKEIAQKVDEAMDKNQRDYYLHEQLHMISEELGEDDDTTAEAEEYPLPPVGGFGAMGLDFDDDYEVVEVEGTEEVEEAEEAKDEVERIEIADADDAWDGFRDADDSRRGGPRSALPTADDSREDVRPKDRAKLSVSQKAPAPKQGAPKSGSRGPRKSSSKGGGPAYGKKNTKKKGNGRGGHR